MAKPWLSSWPRDVPERIEYPEISLVEVLERSVEEAGDRAAIHYPGTEITFKELDKLATNFANALRSLDVKKGDRVAIYLPNIPQFIIACFGALRAGAIVVPVSPLYKERELHSILVDSQAKLIVTWNRLYPYVQSIRAKTELRHAIVTGDGLLPEDSLHTTQGDAKSKSFPDALEMESLLGKHAGSCVQVKIDPRKDLALLQYTGGTTGPPKGAMLTHYNLVVNAAQFAAWLKMRPGQEVHLSALPFFHIYGMTTAMNSPIYTWSPMILIPDARDIVLLQAIDRYQPTIFCGVPAMYISLINYPDLGKHKLRSIRVCVSGATALPGEVQRRFEELTGGQLVEGYGLTEASPVTHVNPLDDPRKNRPGTIGIPISDTDSRIVDLETGERNLPPQTAGELLVCGPQVMVGYWNNPSESNMVLREGWLHTGDIATMDPDGYFRIVDRKKDMINISGLKVWPREVEEVLYEHPAVREAAVISVPDPVKGEAVKAFVVLKDEYRNKIRSDEISVFCMDRIASYKAPRIVEFRDSLPKTSVGKILRRELRGRLAT